MTLSELKNEVSERIDIEQRRIDDTGKEKGRKSNDYYITEGMLIAYHIVNDLLDELELEW